MSGYRILYHHRIRADDGQAVHVRELIGALRENGHEVLECALVPKAEGAVEAAEAPSQGKLWRKLALPRRATELLEIVYGATTHRRLIEAGKRFRPHFLYERHALHCGAGLRAARELGVPLLLETNSPFCEEMKRLGLLRFARRARRTERQVHAGADRVLAVTQVLAAWLTGCGANPDRTIVIPNGAVPTRYGPATHDAGQQLRAARGVPADAFVMGFVGYMRDWHRLDLAVDLLVRPGFDSLHLWLVGEGPALENVIARAATVGARDRLHVIGALNGHEVPAQVCAFDAALIPAINSYASPLKLFDSLAAGVVTLAPRQDNLAEIIDDGRNGVLFDAESPADLERSLAPLVKDRARAAAIGAAGRQSLLDNEWTWSGNARRVVEVFESLREYAEVTR